MRTILISAAALVAVPVFAQTTGDAASAGGATVAAASAAVPAVADARRYCVLQDTTGSRLTRKVCKTRAQWADIGVDVDKDF